jgi:transcriptional regulator with XRE-family HTH domain
MEDGRMTVKAEFGRRLGRKRKRAGLTKPELATKASLSLFYVHRLEQGQQEPRIGTLVALSKALGCCACQLLP